MGVLINLEKDIKAKWSQAFKRGLEKDILKNSEMPQFTLEVPKDKKFGDYATNIAMLLSKKEGKKPRELA